MSRLLSIAIIAASFALVGCAGQAAPVISATSTPLASAVLPPGGVIVTGLQNAAYNLDQAIAIGILQKNDPVDACAHSALQQLGQDTGQTPPPPVPSFQSKVTDLISGGSVMYIIAQQAKTAAANGGIVIPASCEQIVGHLVLTGINAPVNATISALGKLIP